MKADLHTYKVVTANKQAQGRQTVKASDDHPSTGTSKECIKKSDDGSQQKTFSTVFDSTQTEKKVNPSNTDKNKATISLELVTQQNVNNADLTALTGLENLAANFSVEQEKELLSPENFQQVLDIIRNTLAKISSELNLDINYEQLLQDFNGPTLSDAVVEQFAEILYSLSGITDLLENAASEQVALDIKGVLIEPHQAAELEKVLRVETFHLKVALESLGVVEKVSHAVAQKQEMPLPGSGIPQAVDPKILSLPKNQLPQVMSDLICTEENKLKGVIAQMTNLAKEPSPAVEQSTVLQKPFVNKGDSAIPIAPLSTPLEAKKSEQKSLPTKTASTMSVQRPTGRLMPMDRSNLANSLDPQVLRKLLQVDSTPQQHVAKQASKKDVAQDGVQPKVTTGPTFTANQQAAKVFSMGPEVVEPIADTAHATRLESSSASMTQRMPTPQFRTLEEMVLFQVSRKLSSAVKDGVHEIRLVLKPETLGNLRMAIQVEGDVVMARINVENQQVKQIIENNFQNLKDALEEQNLQAGTFDVSVDRNFQNHQDDAEESEQTDRTSIAESDSVKESTVWKMSVGTETGRRFGSNTIEYFA